MPLTKRLLDYLAQDRPDRERLPLQHDDAQRARDLGIDLLRGLVALQLKQRLTGGDCPAVRHEPAGQGSLVHREPKLGQQDFRCHDAAALGIEPGVAIDAGVGAREADDLLHALADRGGIAAGFHLGAMLPAFDHGISVAPRFEHAAGNLLGFRTGKPCDQRGDPFGIALRHTLFALSLAQPFGHARLGTRRNGVDGDAQARQFARGELRQRGDPALGGRIVGLADVGEQRRVRGRVDHASVNGISGLGLEAPVVGGMVQRRERTLQVNLDDAVPLVLAHVHEHAIAQDTGVVDQDVEPTEGIDRLLHHLLRIAPVGDIGRVHRRLAAHRLDRRDDFLRRRLVGTFAGGAGTEIIDDNLGALFGQLERMRASETSSGARNDCDATFQQTHHPSFGMVAPMPSLALDNARQLA
ncbi:hypothetical protein NOVOSPHI9U_260204 [Novosphingobium sp. 9U]|nr:hypothetical protein NOVOSPHI9U_260204 [Novosphingobium sp. 9U]